ncbi:uncharacterized protein LOC121629536 [Melanotaenia boesemani]|uniref:uncharacterized protein LOC121629536 n=1 Tax=Melanotaenia boesemani TaxID=1250792 RepID=UPI001C05BE18|nr:uncharacterized protein LOC121629536 [Melanotaenia boesemani]
MIEKRQELKKTLCHYTSDTFTDMKAVREFCENLSEWMERRETEVDRMKDIKDRADKIDLTFSHVKQSEKKGKAFWNYMKSKFTQKSADSKGAELEKELAEVLKDTLEGLEKLHVFLDAVEKLAVTSLHVFAENQLLHLPRKIKLSHVQAAIKAARLICPLLLEFKRDAKVFFLPKLQNVEVLVYQLDRYMQTTETICEEMKKSRISDFCLTMTVVDLNASLSEHEVHTMVDHINQLNEIRMDPNFRMVFLFKEKSCHEFIKEFNERKPRMLEFLKGMEENAVQLDKMNKGAKISSVAGSSVGAIGGVFSIVGLALIPVTAGVSLGLMMAGVVLGVTSGVNNIVTTSTEVGVNYTQKKKAKEVFKSFMEDVESLQKCLDEVTKQPAANVEPSKIDVAVGVGKVASKLGAAGKGIDSLIDLRSATKLLKNEQ